jgi:competence protein ComEC
VRAPETASKIGESAGIDALRARLSARIAQAVPAPGARFVQALALGDTRALSESDWDTLRATGLTHQIAISGFHVGIVASFGALLAWLTYRLFPRLGLRWPRVQAQAVFALAFGTGYTALVGFELPTVRTLLMIAAALLARLWRRPASVPSTLALALAAMLIVDPLCVLAAGFWLSFAGVAWLVWCLPHDAPRGQLRAFLGAQGVATIGLLPLTVWFFGQASLLSPLTNLIGIPWFSLVVVPLSLIGLGVDLVWPAAGAMILRLAARAMDGLWWVLTHAAQWPGALVWLPEPGPFALAMALIGAFWLLLPRGIPGKPLALLLWLPLLWPRMPEIPTGTADLAMIDVGQGPFAAGAHRASRVAVRYRTCLQRRARPRRSGGCADAARVRFAKARRARGKPRRQRPFRRRGSGAACVSGRLAPCARGLAERTRLFAVHSGHAMELGRCELPLPASAQGLPVLRQRQRLRAAHRRARLGGAAARGHRSGDRATPGA